MIDLAFCFAPATTLESSQLGSRSLEPRRVVCPSAAPSRRLANREWSSSSSSSSCSPRARPPLVERWAPPVGRRSELAGRASLPARHLSARRALRWSHFRLTRWRRGRPAGATAERGPARVGPPGRILELISGRRRAGNRRLRLNGRGLLLVIGLPLVLLAVASRGRRAIWLIRALSWSLHGALARRLSRRPASS